MRGRAKMAGGRGPLKMDEGKGRPVAEPLGEYAGMRPHERLDCWKLAMDVVEEVYRVTKTFPKEETYGLASQMRRASVSVPANIAEGSARKTDQEKRQFYYIARASLSELETHVEIARRLQFMPDDAVSLLQKKCSRIAAMINGMVRR
jgi:four helix bundle protein